MPDIEIEVEGEIIELLITKAELEGVSLDDLVRRLVIEASGIEPVGRSGIPSER
ncbi:MAG: hypothetical protein HY055_06110 [Magnetospirillum sp.]|nr:hypothetical protein [Magnetospirillum sp.]